MPSYIQRILQLAEQGITGMEFAEYDVDWQSEAYGTVSGQNSNNSVRLSDEFMQAVEADGDWNLIRRTDGGVAKTIKAQELWISFKCSVVMRGPWIAIRYHHQ